MTQSPTISVIIPTFNRREILARTLPTVFDQDFPGDEYEVIVVVDGSTDGSIELLRALKPACGFLVIEQKNSGQTVALNAGVKAATGRLILRLDDDLLCDRSLVAEHTVAHSGGEPALVFGWTMVSSQSQWSLETECMRVESDAYYERLQHGGGPVWPQDAWVGPNCSMSRMTYLQCGGYDERLPRRFEDVEMGLRLWKSGCQFRFWPKAVTHHLCTKSEGEMARDLEIEGKSLIALCRIHPEYRAHTSLAQVVQGPSWKRATYRITAHVPFLAALFLSPPLWLASRLGRVIPWVRRVGIRLHSVRKNVAWLQGAVAELGSWKNFQGMFGFRLSVLLYHRVGEARSSEYPGLTVSPQKFERQVRWLARRGYVGIRAAEWLEWCREGKPLPDKPVLLTFDDAYADVAENALPVLKRYGFSGTVFVVTECLDGTNTWDRGTWRTDLQIMTAGQVRHWASQGIEFGGHTRTHANLRNLDEARLEEEVEGGARDLACILEARAVCFAYPYGECNEAVQQCAQQAFAMAFTCDEGLNDLTTPLHRLRRTMVDSHDSLIDFWPRVHWGYSPVRNLRARLRIRTRLKSAVRLVFGWRTP